PRSIHHAIRERGRTRPGGGSSAQPSPARLAARERTQEARSIPEDDVMTRHDRDVGQARWCPARLPFWLLRGLGAAALVLAGCATINQPRGKADDEPEAARYDLPTVGERTVVANAAPLMLGGVGLVEGLEGTGGDCPHDSYRAMLVEHLKKE